MTLERPLHVAQCQSFGHKAPRRAVRRPEGVLARARSIATTGACTRAHDHAGAIRRVPARGGPRSPSWPPSRSPGSFLFAGEKAWGSVIRALWGSDGLVCLSQCHEVLPQRGHGPSRTITASAGQGSDKAIMAPSRVPRTGCYAGKVRGVRDSRPVGSGMDSSACRREGLRRSAR
jgi:hypothetical protein